jgi:hypothetical protein
MSFEKTLDLGVLVLSVLLFLYVARAAWLSWRIYAGTGRRRQEDASAEPVEPSPSVRDRAAVLASLGYRTIGKTKLTLPHKVLYAWIVAAEDARSYAILVNSRPGSTGIYTAWSDGTWLGTMHPHGGAIDRLGLHLRVVGNTLDEAVRVHREGLERLRATHGEPRPIRTMPDLLELDADYRARFGGAELRPITMQNILLAALTGVAALLAIVLLGLR